MRISLDSAATSRKSAVETPDSNLKRRRPRALDPGGTPLDLDPMRRFFLLIVLFAANRISAEVQFLGVMGDSKRTYFAVRPDEAVATEWVRVGEKVGSFTVASYDAETEALTLRSDGQSVVLKMPSAQVKTMIDDVAVGLGKILNLPGARSRLDLLHPALRPLFKESDSRGLEHVLAPGTINQIKPLTEDEMTMLEKGLSAVEKVVGTRPKHGLWTKRSKGGLTMSFVVNVGDAWYLAPRVPDGGESR